MKIFTLMLILLGGLTVLTFFRSLAIQETADDLNARVLVLTKLADVEKQLDAQKDVTPTDIAGISVAERLLFLDERISAVERRLRQ